MSFNLIYVSVLSEVLFHDRRGFYLRVSPRDVLQVAPVRPPLSSVNRKHLLSRPCSASDWLVLVAVIGWVCCLVLMIG